MDALNRIITVGVDVGQKVDPTAIVVCELEWRPDEQGKPREHYTARLMERLKLGTSYPNLAGRVTAIVAGVIDRQQVTPRVYCDATGVGTPFLDCLKAAGLAAPVTAVYFTHGDRRGFEPGHITLGKAWLVSRLQALMQGRQIHLPKGREAQTMMKELLDYEIRIDERANDRYGAFKVGSHDDLVTALGLAVQGAGPGYRAVSLAGEGRSSGGSRSPLDRGLGQREVTTSLHWSPKTIFPGE